MTAYYNEHDPKAAAWLRELGPQTVNLAGRMFGYWKVIAFSGYRSPSSRHAYWQCECQCGRQQDVRGTQLIRGVSIQCGECNKRSARLAGKYSRRRMDIGEAAFRSLFDNYCRNAKKRSIPFMLTMDQSRKLFQGNCYFCGIGPLTVKKARHSNSGDYYYNGIDRLDNAQGYLLENCVSCCAVCNFAKRDMPVNEFMDWICRVYRHCKDTNRA